MVMGNLQKGSEEAGGRMEGPGRQAGLSVGWYIAFSQGSQRLVSPDPYEDLSQAPRTKCSEECFDSFRDEKT